MPRHLLLALVIVLSASWAHDVHADPANTSSLPLKVQGVGPVAVAGNTIYFGGAFAAVPRSNAGRGVGLFSTTEAVGRSFASVSGGASVVVSDQAGGWYVGGDFASVDGVPRGRLAHIRADGALDPAFVANVVGSVSSLALSGNLLFVGGSFTTVNLVPRNGLAIVSAVTGAVQAAAPTINGTANALLVTAGTLFVGGTFSMAGGQPRVGLAAFDAVTGALRPGFTANLGAGQSASTLATDGSWLFVGGAFTTVNGMARAYVAKVNATSGVLDGNWNPAADATVNALVRADTTIFVGGDFSTVGGATRSRLAALTTDTGVATSWRADADASVLGLAHDNGTLYAVGFFDSVGGIRRRAAAALSGSAPGAVLPWHPSLSPFARSVAVRGGAVVVAGDFEAWGATYTGGIVAADLVTGEAIEWAPGVTGVSVLVAAGRRLIVGGAFTTAAGVPRRNLAVFDLDTRALLPISVTMDGPVSSLAVAGDALYVGGDFTLVNGTFRLNLAAIDLNDGTLLPWNPQPDGPIYAMAARTGSVVVGGSFLSVVGTNGQQARNALAEITTAGAVTLFNPGIASGSVRAMAISASTLYYGGDFVTVQVSSRPFAAAADLAVGDLLPWNPVLNASPQAMRVHRGSVYLTGAFTSVGAQLRNRAARVDGTSGAVQAWNPGPAFTSGHGLDVTDAGVALSARSVIGRDSGGFYPDEALSGVPGPSTPPRIDLAGATLTVAWDAPVFGPRPGGYLLEAGSAPGLSNIATLPLTATTFTVGGVPPGTFFLRVRAVGPAGAGAPSREVQFAVGAPTCTRPPRATPTPAIVVAGGTVLIDWSASHGSAPTSFTLAAGTAAGLANIGAFAMGGGTSFSTTGVPAGAYFVRVVGANACGAAPASPDAIVRVGGVPGPPGAPLGLTASTSVGTVSLSWSGGVSGGVPTAHQLEAGSGPALSNVGTFPLGAGTSFAAGGVPPGTYYVRVRALNALGASPPSGEVLLVVP